MEQSWVLDIRDQCRAAGVAFFFKQWGGVFKSRTGRELDGRTWNEMPARVDRDRVSWPVTLVEQGFVGKKGQETSKGQGACEQRRQRRRVAHADSTQAA